MSAFGSPSRLPAPAPEPVPIRLPQPAPSPPKKPSNWKYWIFAALVAGGGLAAYQLMSRPQHGQGEISAGVQTAKLETGPLERVLRLTGETSARNFASITVPIMRGPEATREMVLVELAAAGTFVKKGDLVARIDARSADDHIEDVKSSILQASANIKKRQAEQAVDWENLQQTLRVAKAELDKARLDNQAAEVRPLVNQELLKLAVEEAEARYKQLQRDIAEKQAIYKAELRLLEIAHQREVMHLERHLIDQKRMTFHAPMDGLVVVSTFFRAGENAQFQKGDQVSSGQTFMKIVDISSMQVETSANQTESGQLRVGQEARIYLDAFPGLTFKGKVHSIGAIGVGGWRQSYYIRTVPVRVAIEGSDPRLIPDLSAAVDVVVERKENALLLPLAALHSRNGQNTVLVKQGDRFESREVALGLRNSTHVEIVSGLKPGGEVAVGAVSSPVKSAE